MLKKILKGSSCAKCRLCCIFDSSDVWETPVFSRRSAEKLLEIKADTEFIPMGDMFRLKIGKLSEEDLFTCPALSENGCILGENKPFDCKIWPYRIMDVQGKKAITIASVCGELYSRPLSQLVEFLKEGLGDEIFEYARIHPEIIKPYEEGYPILIFEK